MSIERDPLYIAGQLGQPLDEEYLARRAQVHFGIMQISHIIEEADYFTLEAQRAVIDVATFGDVADIDRAHFALLRLMDRDDNTAAFELIRNPGHYEAILTDHMTASAELGDDRYGGATTALFDAVPYRPDETFRVELAIENAAKGTQGVIDHAYELIKRSQLTAKKLEWLARLNAQGHYDYTQEIAALSWDLDLAGALKVLLPDGIEPEHIPQEYINIARGRFELVGWATFDKYDELDPDEQLVFAESLYKLWKATSDDSLAAKFRYYLGEIPDCDEKLALLARTADINPDAVEQIYHYDDDLGASFVHKLIEAYSRQGEPDIAAEAAFEMPNKVQRLIGLQMVASLTHDPFYIDRVSELIPQLMSGQADAQTTAFVGRLIESKRLPEALHIHDMIADPMLKLFVLRNIARVNRGHHPLVRTYL